MRRIGLIAVAVLLACMSGAAQIATVMPYPVIQFVDTNGKPLAGGLLYTCQQGMSCPGTTQTTYFDSALSTPHANPIVLDSAGRATVYLSAATYKFVLQTSAGVTVWTQDNISALAQYNLGSLNGKITFNAPTVLTISANAITPTQNVHGVDTSGGAGSLTTINTSNVSQAFQLFLYPNTPAGNPVTVNSGGNIVLAGTPFVMNTTSSWIHFIFKGSNWFEIGRSATGSLCSWNIVAKTGNYSAALCDLVEFTSGTNTLTLPLASTCTSGVTTIGMKNDTANVQTIARSGGDTIDGAASFVTGGIQYESYDFVCNAAKTGWMVR